LGCPSASQNPFGFQSQKPSGHQQAHNAETKLRKQLDKGLAAVLALNERKRGKKRYREVKSLQEKVEKLLDEYGITGLLHLSYRERSVERDVRGYGGRAPRKEIENNAEVEACVNQVALNEAVRRLGWRVYGTNAQSDSLDFPAAVRKYRANYSIEGSFKRLKGKPLSIQPMHLQRENHVIGLVRLLSICLRVLVLLEFVARRALKTSGEPLREVYAGNPKRGTMRPSAELLLSTFKEVTLTLVEGRGSQEHYITPLSPPQQRILELLDLPQTLYESLSFGFCRSPPHGEMEST
jgi:transposase